MSNSYKDFFEKAQKKTGVIQKKPSSVRSPRSLKSKQTVSLTSNSASLKSKNNKIMIGFVFIGFVITLLGSFYIDETIQMLKSVEISFFSQAGAQQNTKTGVTSSGDQSTKSVGDAGDKNERSETSQKIETDNGEIELNHLARLRERKQELDKREADLVKLEEELSQQRKDLELKLKELENIRRNISSTLEEKVQNDDQKIQDLVLFYSNMKPPQAAKILETIDESLAVRIIEKMKKKNAADIMNLLNPEKAQALSEKYAGYRK